MISKVAQFFLFFAVILTGSLYSQQTYLYYHNGFPRSYTLYLPDELPEKAPLVFVLHGYGSNSAQVMSYAEMNKQADEHKFVVCYPQGTADSNGISHWNARLGISNTDDIGFLTELAFYLQEAYVLDEERTFSCGHSNGGFMCYTLACEAPDVFRAVASMAGTMSGYTWNNREIAVPIPILQIHGVDDPTVPIDGSIPWAGWAGAPHMDSVVRFWAEINQCTSSSQQFYPNLTMAHYFTDGINNNEVWYYKINNWGHSWPYSQISQNSGTIAAEVIWNFFAKMSEGTSYVDQVYSESKADWRIYPNPVESVLFLETKEKPPGLFTILSITGKELYSGWHEGSISKIDLSGINPGLCFFRYQNKTLRFIIQ